MYKAFLSHSSADKEFVRAIAAELGRQYCLFDEQVFENGETFKLSIEKMLGDSDVFVLFATEDSIKRMWVNFEIEEAWYAKLEGRLSKALVFLLDSSLEFKSIPSWLSRAKISQALAPKLTAREIRQHLDDLLRTDRQPFFEGRSEDVERLERLLTPIDAAPPRILGIQGLPSIGRRTFVSRTCRSALSLNRILPIDISDGDQLTEISIKIADKLEPYSTREGFDRITERIRGESDSLRLVRTLRNLSTATANGELPVLFDTGGMFDGNGVFTLGVSSLLDGLRDSDDVYLFVVSNRKPPPDIPTLPLKPLSDEHTRRLITKIANHKKLALSPAQVRDLAEYVNGYPPSAYYAVDQCQEYGIQSVLADKNRLIQFRSSAFVKFLNQQKLSDAQRSILLILARYSPIPLKVLADATKLSAGGLLESLRGLVDHSLVGPTDTGLYEISSPVADAVVSEFRSDAQVDHAAIFTSLRDAIGQDDDELPRLDLYRLLFKASVRSGGSAEDLFHFTNDLIDITVDFYHRREYREAINSARLTIEELATSNTAWDFLIRALIQEGDWSDALQAIEKYAEFGPMRDIYYLRGFLCRKKGDHREAINFYLQAEKHGRSNFSLKREIATCYFLLDDFDSAKIYVNDGLSLRENSQLLDLKIQIATREGDEGLDRSTLGRLAAIDGPAFVQHRTSTIELAFGNVADALIAARNAVNLINDGRPHFNMLAQLITCLTKVRDFGGADAVLAQINRLYARQNRDVRLGLECRLEIDRGRYKQGLEVLKSIDDPSRLVYRLMERDAIRGLLNGAALSDAERGAYEDALAKLEIDLPAQNAATAITAMIH